MRSFCLGLGLSAAALFTMSSAWAEIPRTAAPEGASVYFITPNDGATVDQTFTVKFGLKGMGVAPAGIDVPETGHHHLLIDTETLPDMSQTLPATDNIRHFGKGQTEAELTLKPGKHTLQLLLGDKNHVPHNPPVLSEKITVTVK
ncbi:DUF4399 domain-containing protein [Pseudomonas sp. TTU2014-080ASC]|uniref:DUF4399 domain-containing protein n=1 Tax=Pseudomonas sp. TTU2014-080ASC TaxID=1729724 RepID=UPI0007183863|nr:DUF4399 domain-containing protein [Pseudomonas sp. TTU2014-080ASC]KRW61185.1 rod shape-determining protein RodA [Pseudomonas sp. TTU2014-080ASC]